MDEKAANEGLAITKMNKHRLKRSNIKRQEIHIPTSFHPRPMPEFLKGFLLETINRQRS